MHLHGNRRTHQTSDSAVSDRKQLTGDRCLPDSGNQTRPPENVFAMCQDHWYRCMTNLSDAEEHYKVAKETASEATAAVTLVIKTLCVPRLRLQLFGVGLLSLDTVIKDPHYFTRIDVLMYFELLLRVINTWEVLFIHIWEVLCRKHFHPEMKLVFQ